MDAYAGPYRIGYHFRPKQDIQVATLGFYDDQMNGLTPSNSHSVAIYDAVMKVSVVDTHVTNADPLRGFFRYHPVANVTLKQGYDYFIMADSSGENYAQNVTDFIVDSSITQLGYAINTTAPTLGAEYPEYTDSTTPFFGPTFEILGNPVHPPFFTGEVGLANGVSYLSFADGNYFGYYSYLNPSTYIYHQDPGYEYVFDAADGNAGVYFYDFASGDFFYTSPSFPFPYLYDFKLNTVLYYYPDPNTPGHYNTAGVRYFYNLATGTTISR